MRIFVAQILECEGYARHEAFDRLQRFGGGGEQAHHFGRRLQMPFGIDCELAAGGLHRGLLADRGHHVVQRAIRGRGVERLVERDQRRAGPRGLLAPTRQTARVAPFAQHRRAQPHAAGRGLDQRGEQVVARRGQDDQLQVFEEIEQILPVEQAVALFGAQVAGGEQPRQPPPAAPRNRVGEDFRRIVGEGESRADQQAEAGRGQPFLLRLLARLAQRDMRAHDPRHGVAVGDADARVAELQRARDHVRGRARPAQERIARRRRQLGIEGRAAAHANNPWMYHCGCSLSL